MTHQHLQQVHMRMLEVQEIKLDLLQGSLWTHGRQMRQAEGTTSRVR